MKLKWNLFKTKRKYFFFLPCIILVNNLLAQQTQITDYVVFGGQKTSTPPQTIPSSPGFAVQVSSSCIFQEGSKGKGAIGSYNLVKSTGNLTVDGNIFSGGIIQLANSNVVTGRIAAANATTIPGPLPASATILSVGSNANLGGNIDVNGNIVIGGGVVSGVVTYPGPPYTYTGPGSAIAGTPMLPGLPEMPVINSFPAANSNNISTTRTIAPGVFGNITLGGNKTLTLSGTGIYVFNSIKNSGTSNNFVFDFKNLPGTIKIYIHGDVDLGKVKASIINDGGTGASRIYSETHGKGSTSTDGTVAWTIANGSAGSASKWVGTIWAPYAAINIGSGTGSTFVTGALWSGTQVNIQSGITVVFEPFSFCDSPITADAGIDRPLDFSTYTRLNGSPTTGVTYNWQAFNGGMIYTSPPTAAAVDVTAAGGYILTVAGIANPKCIARDTVIISSRLNSLIGSELQSIYDNNLSSSPFFVIKPDTVTIDIIVNAGYREAVKTLLQGPDYGLRDTLSNGASSFIITGKFPIKNLPKLNLLYQQINYCRPYYQGYSNSGLTTSAGDTSVRSYLVRKGYDLTGDGIKIGVISNSYNTITASTTTPLITNTAVQDISNGDLPGPGNPAGYTKPIVVLKDFPAVRSDEGRAMLQIVHDVAPAAELYFRTGSITAGDFAKGIKDLHDAGCSVIVDDITYITEPFLKDGVIANAVDAVTALGTTYFSAAGNFASKSYEKNYLPAPAPAGFNGTAHDFGGGDIYNNVTLPPGDYTIVLQWVDDIHSIGQGGTKYDLDIYLTSNTNGTELFGFNRNNTNGDPIEFIPFTVTTTTNTNMLIVNNTIGSNPSRIKVVVFRGDIRFNENNTGRDSSTIVGQANAVGAIAIGAARFDKALPYPGPLAIESFSSTGGTSVNGVKRNKPELVGPDGVNTTVNMGPDYPTAITDRYSNFFGTSAAAPHAAAVAALIMQGRKKFLNQPVTTPGQIRSLLQSTAIDMHTPGFDLTSGYGFINADLAFRTFAAPRPSINKLVVPQTNPLTIPGSSVFTLKVKGENFSNNSVIYYGDTPLATTVLSTDSATAEMPLFSGNPPIRVYTPPYPTTIVVNGQHLDGGFSNSLFFFGADITVSAVNATKKYGQEFPALDTIIKVDGVLLKNTNPSLTLADIGLTNMTLTVPPTAINPGDVGTYAITPARVFNQSNPDDVELLKKYNYTFIPATLTIEKLPLTITAQNLTTVYGDKVPNTTFTYQFDATGIPNPAVFLNTIVTSHNSQLAKDATGNDVYGLVNGQAVTIDNGQAVTIENGKGVTIENGQAVTIENGVQVPVINVQALTIVNGIVTDTSGVPLTNADVNNLSFLATTKSLQTTRQIPNQMNIIDITQESILDFNVNAAQTYMLSSVTNAGPKGLVDVLSYENGKGVVIENGKAVTIENGIEITIVNGKGVTIENGQAVTIENGEAIPIVSSKNRTAVIVDASEIGQGLSPLKSLNIITGLAAGQQNILPGTFLNNNFQTTYIAGNLTINKKSLQVKANNVTRQYGDPDPGLTVTYTGFATEENLQNAGIMGTPALSTTATLTSPEGTYPITVSNGTLVSTNYAFSFVNGIYTITSNPCFLTHSTFKNFGSTTSAPTSVWLSMTTKVSGQLNAHGDYLLFKGGTITFNNISSTPLINNLAIPDGKIIADNTITTPSTSYNVSLNIWITKVPVGFSSTSDIFVTGAIINSSTGFIKVDRNTSSVLKGLFYCTKYFKDQWGYATAAYQPMFSYSSIADSGLVTAINGTYRAGTPTTQIQNLVNGGSGGGGNNYTGSSSAYDNFTACSIVTTAAENRGNNMLLITETEPAPKAEETIRLVPNPASAFINLSLIPSRTGRVKIEIYSMEGIKVMERNSAVSEAGRQYIQQIDVSKLTSGIYLVRVSCADKSTVKKIIISR